MRHPNTCSENLRQLDLDKLRYCRLIETNLHGLDSEAVTACGTLFLAELHVAEFSDGPTLMLLRCRSVWVLRYHLLTNTGSALENRFERAFEEHQMY